MAGSTPIRRITQAIEPPDAGVAATVRGRGSRRVLSYRIRRRPDQRVTFLELDRGGAARAIGAVNSGGRGRIRFIPAPGAGTRRVVAQFELAGLPAERRTVARFRPPSPRLGRPARLRVSRRGTTLRASWQRVAGASRYEVVLKPSSGRSRLIRVRGPRATIGGVARTLSGSVGVRAVTSQREGRPILARFRHTARPRTGFRALPRCRVQRRKITCSRR